MPQNTHTAVKCFCDPNNLSFPPYVIFISDKETLPPREKDASIDVNSMTSPSEHLSIRLSSTYRNNLPFTRATRKGYREESGEVGCMVDNDLSETKQAGEPRYGKTSTASLYQQWLMYATSIAALYLALSNAG